MSHSGHSLFLRLGYWAMSSILCPFFLASLLLLRIGVSSKVVSRPKKGVSPRLLWGCTPLTNIKYASQALIKAGYFSKTFVNTYYERIGEKTDFDLYRTEIFSIYKFLPKPVVLLIEPYLSFGYLLMKFDIFHFFYDGGILSRTPLRFLEIQLLHIFNKRVVVMPYGADAHELSTMMNREYKFVQLYQYGGALIQNMHIIRKWIDYFSRWADFCVGSINFDGLYRWDILPVSYLAVDTEMWKLKSGRNDQSGKGDVAPVIIAHSPNHRLIKGTEYVYAAVNKLKEEGFSIELLLLENMKNSEVRTALERCDIFVELLITGYGLSGIEGMALGKPVISNFQGDVSVLRHYSYLDECPVVRADFDNLYDKLKWLVEHPDDRNDVGEKSRKYVEKYHSYMAQQIIWKEIYRKIWFAENVDTMLLFHPLMGNYSDLYNRYCSKQRSTTP